MLRCLMLIVLMLTPTLLAQMALSESGKYEENWWQRGRNRP